MLTKFVRIAVEGATSDGRTIQRADLEQMGRNYNQEKYGARIWLEHIRGILPASDFKAYGDVVATKTEEVEIAGEKKLALFAKLDVTDEMIGFNKKRQKIYTSMEIQPNFAKSGEAYLTGLAVTDSPASLGTEALKLFSTRKQDKDNIFTEAVETELELEEETQPNQGASLFSKVKELLGIKDKADTEHFTGVTQAIELLANSQKTVLEQFSAFTKQIETLTADLKKASDDAAADRKAFNDLKADLEKQPDGAKPRPAAKGGNGHIATDC